MTPAQMVQAIGRGEADTSLSALYGADALDAARRRCLHILDTFINHYGQREGVALFSAPGRTEIGGNHTDHNHGRVLAAAVNLDMLAAAAPTPDGIVRFASKGFPENVVNLSVLSPVPAEREHSPSLIRGIAARLHEKGHAIGGLCAYMESEVLKGSGLSSSAALEVLVTHIFNGLYGNGMSAVEVAQISQYAENAYFGKPSGLMDQTASSVGGFVGIDFADNDNPVVMPVAFDFASAQHTLCITDTGGNHGDLTGCYASIKEEMSRVAAYFSKKVLREVAFDDLIANAASIRAQCGDRAFLRAYHFFQEDERASLQAKALQNNDFASFLALVRESGRSSAVYLQNLYDPAHPTQQEIVVGLSLSEAFLGSDGACRVHGGGFAGTIQAFVPAGKAREYVRFMESVFGKGSCYCLQIRKIGGTKVF